MKGDRLRDRLLIRFAASLLLGFLLFGGGLFGLVTFGMFRSLDAELASEADWIEAVLKADAATDDKEGLEDIAEHVAPRRNQEGVLLFRDGKLLFSSFAFVEDAPSAPTVGTGRPAEESPFVLSRPTTLGALSPLLSAAGRTRAGRTAELGEGSPEYRVFVRRLAPRGAGAEDLVVLGLVSGVRRVQGQFLLWLAILVPAIGLPFVLWARRASRAISRPLERMAEDMARVSVRSLARPLAAAGGYRETESLVEAFNRMAGRLERSIEAIGRFTSDASHELRTPLAVLKTQFQAALGESGPEGLRPALESGLEELGTLERIVNGLLMLSRYDSGKMTVERVPVDLTDLLVEACARASAAAARADVRLELDDAPPVRLVGDPTLIALLLANVLDNAVKYNRRGGRVGVRLVSDAAGGRCRVIVDDTGIGIPAADLDRVFERFYRADPSRSRAAGGSGLGLSLVRLIAELHGGRVDLFSREGEGTRIEIELPLTEKTEERSGGPAPVAA